MNQRRKETGTVHGANIFFNDARFLLLHLSILPALILHQED